MLYCNTCRVLLSITLRASSLQGSYTPAIWIGVPTIRLDFQKLFRSNIQYLLLGAIHLKSVASEFKLLPGSILCKNGQEFVFLVLYRIHAVAYLGVLGSKFPQAPSGEVQQNCLLPPLNTPVATLLWRLSSSIFLSPRRVFWKWEKLCLASSIPEGLSEAKNHAVGMGRWHPPPGTPLNPCGLTICFTISWTFFFGRGKSFCWEPFITPIF